jgi:hypothetical protein
VHAFRSAAPCSRPADRRVVDTAADVAIVAGQLAAGEDPMLAAAIVKDLGNTFEQSLPPLVQSLVDENVRLEDDSDLARTLALLLQTSPSFSLRGGTREILRGIVARGLGLR